MPGVPAGSTVGVAAARRKVGALLAAAVAAGALPTSLAGKSSPQGSPLAVLHGPDARGAPLGQPTVELLRFVTAYGTGFEALVDATPYSPLLEAARSVRDGSEVLTFYAFVDSWVNNETGHDAMYMDNVTGQCSPLVKSYGNGWSLSAELIFWPRQSAAPRVRPRHSVTLASGYFGGDYPLGKIAVHEGNLSSGGDAVLLQQKVELDGSADVRVYECPKGASKIQHAAALGYLSQRVEQLSRKGEEKSVDELVNYTFEGLAMDEVVQLTDATVRGAGEARVVAKYNMKECSPAPGMPVFFALGDVFTDRVMSTGLWWNLTYPFEPVGHVEAVGVSGNGTLDIVLDAACPPTNKTTLGSTVPHLIMPKSPDALSVLRAQVTEAARMGSEGAKRPARAGGSIASPLLLLPDEPLQAGGGSRSLLASATVALREPKLLGHINSTVRAALVDVTAGRFRLHAEERQASRGVRSGSGKHEPEAPARVCVVQTQRQGRLFQRNFELPVAEPGDRVILQLVVTGHGWSDTTEQCGEYCHALYQLMLNGQLARNVTQFRNDCNENPVGVDGTQKGTWWESRNGWCPGSVEPGIFLDVTQWVRDGPNHLDMDVLVWNELSKAYEPYTDFRGFAFRDAAFLIVSLNVFVYDAASVAASQAMERPLTAAEAALRRGQGGVGDVDPNGPPVTQEPLVSLWQARPSMPRLRTLTAARSLASEDAEQRERVLLAARVEDEHPAVQTPASRGSEGGSGPHAGGFPDFEGSEPWYNASGAAKSDGLVHVPVLTEVLMQGARRQVSARVSAADLPADWDQVALRFQLGKPPDPLKYDRWDRVGSVGLSLEGQLVERFRVQTEPPLTSASQWALIP